MPHVGKLFLHFCALSLQPFWVIICWCFPSLLKYLNPCHLLFSHLCYFSFSSDFLPPESLLRLVSWRPTLQSLYQRWLKDIWSGFIQYKYFQVDMSRPCNMCHVMLPSPAALIEHMNKNHFRCFVQSIGSIEQKLVLRGLAGLNIVQQGVPPRPNLSTPPSPG